MLSPLLMWNTIGSIVGLMQKVLDITLEGSLDMYYCFRTNTTPLQYSISFVDRILHKKR